MAEEKKAVEDNKINENELAKARELVKKAEAAVEAERQKRLEEENKPKKFIPGKYGCLSKRFHAGKLYEVGEVEIFTEDFLPPLSKPDKKGEQFVRHFRLIED